MTDSKIDLTSDHSSVYIEENISLDSLNREYYNCNGTEHCDKNKMLVMMKVNAVEETSDIGEERSPIRPEHKTFKIAVIVIALSIVAISMILVTATLSMSKNIDDIGM